MNPYDFVRIDWQHPPEREKPVWHHRLFDTNKELYSGHIEIDIYVETPLFIFDPYSKVADGRQAGSDAKRPAQFIQNGQKEYIIPGSSLKGMLRSVVEALGNGCLTLFDGQYKDDRNKDRRSPTREIDYRKKIAPSFQHCHTNSNLCISCRIFGMLKDRVSGVFLGKVNIGDARAQADRVYIGKPMYTAVLSKPKPHHSAFYLDEEERYIAGRKFYFHHDQDQILTASHFIPSGKTNPKPANRYIQPLGYDTRFHFCLDFTNLATEEFAHLMQAIILEEGMRHKIGYGKPLGLGTIELKPMRLTLIDYAARYKQPSNGLTVREGDEMWKFLYKQIDKLSERQRLDGAEADEPTPAEDLRRIWQWPPDPEVDYVYPGKNNWFDKPGNARKRIIDTEYAPADPVR